MNGKTLISFLVEDVLVPELLNAIHKTVPTDQTITITLSKDANTLRALSQPFIDELKAAGVTTDPPPITVPSAI